MKIKKLFLLLLTVIFSFCFVSCDFSSAEQYITKDINWVIKAIEDYYYDDKELSYSDYAKLIVDSVCDEYSEFYTKEEYEALVEADSGNVIGIGVTFLKSSTDATIHTVYGNSPAENAGITAGGKIIKVNDTDVADYDEFSKEVLSKAVGEKFTLTIDYGGVIKTFTLAREAFVSNLVTYADKDKGFRFNGEKGTNMVEKEGGNIPELPDNTAYVKFTNFYGDNTVQNIESCLDYAVGKGKTNIVIDLRSNGGGYVSMMSDIVALFVEGGKKLTAVAELKSGKTELYYTAKENCRKFDKVYVLADEYSASASEALMGALIDYEVISYSDIIIQNENPEEGISRTFGKGIMQSTLVNNVTGDALKITTARILWPVSGTCIHGVGIKATAENSTSTDAETLSRLVEILTK